MTTTAVTDRHAVPDGPPKLTPAQLRQVQLQTLDAPRLRYSLLARALFKMMDIGYGRKGAIVKFVMLEYIARVPIRPGSGWVTWRWRSTVGVPRWHGESSTGSSRPELSRTTSNGTC